MCSGLGSGNEDYNGSIFHPLFMRELTNGLYFSIFFSIISGENLSLQYVNSMNCMMRLLLWFVRRSDSYANSFIHSIFGLNLVLLWHVCHAFMHTSSHGGTIFSGGLF